jgi:hypothetical protein
MNHCQDRVAIGYEIFAGGVKIGEFYSSLVASVSKMGHYSTHKHDDKIRRVARRQPILEFLAGFAS